MARQKAPGKAHRKGITLVEVMDMFPNKQAATEWFEQQVWGDSGRCCGHCGSVQTKQVPSAKPMPYWCRDCRSYFSVRTGTPLACSNVCIRKWAIAVYLVSTSLKGVSSMKLHRDLGVTQRTAWYMLHRLRKAWEEESDDPFDGPVEVDETYIGGKRKNMPKHKREELTGRGAVGEMVGAEVSSEATVYTDESSVYTKLDNHEAVNHSGGEHVRGDAHVNGIESFWSMFKRGYYGTYHRMSAKHLHRYVTEFAGRHNVRDRDTLDQMQAMVAGMVGTRLLYRELLA